MQEEQEGGRRAPSWWRWARWVLLGLGLGCCVPPALFFYVFAWVPVERVHSAHDQLRPGMEATEAIRTLEEVTHFRSRISISLSQPGAANLELRAGRSLPQADVDAFLSKTSPERPCRVDAYTTTSRVSFDLKIGSDGRVLAVSPINEALK